MKIIDSFVSVSGVSFLEFSGPNPQLLDSLFLQMEFKKSDSSTLPLVNLYSQGKVNFISNPQCGGSAEVFRDKHVRGVSAIGFSVEDSEDAFELAISLGAEAVENADFDIPAIRGVGNSIIYLVDKVKEFHLLSQFKALSVPHSDESSSSREIFERIDHLTHNLNIGGVERMREFYKRVFGFDKKRTFSIHGKQTGLYSEVISSPDGSVIIPLNESMDDLSQIAEYLREYNGEGVQHIALATVDICQAVDCLSSNGIPFQDTPDTYYELLEERLPGHGQNIDKLFERKILLDGGDDQGGGYLLQIFTKNSIGPIFFEFIQRKGNDGFGEGNFQALFESIELEQERRGVFS